MLDSLRIVTELADDLAARQLDEPVLAWHWGPALLGFGFSQLEDELGDERYREWLLRYCDFYVGHPPVIESADTAAPGLITYEMTKKTGDRYYEALTDQVVTYVREAPRLVGDAVNHLGTAFSSHIYPKSVWVDSLMMFSVFPARYGREQGDAALIDLAARLPRQYADLLQGEEGLWAHSYWTPTRFRRGRAFPGGGLYWGRGNGWVVTALPMILDAIGRDHPEADAIVEILRRTSAALLPLQRPDGTWTTLLRPRGGGYRELSTTALVAAGWLQAVRGGYLDEAYLPPARAALNAVLTSLKRVDGQWIMPEISGPTIPMPVLPRLGYSLMPRLDNETYGVGALIFAALNAHRLG